MLVLAATMCKRSVEQKIQALHTEHQADHHGGQQKYHLVCLRHIVEYSRGKGLNTRGERELMRPPAWAGPGGSSSLQSFLLEPHQARASAATCTQIEGRTHVHQKVETGDGL